MLLRNYCAVPDPAIDASFSDRTLPFLPIVTEIHAGLTKINEINGPGVEPDLAESWTVNEDSTLYIFRMRGDLKFSDGTNLTAADVKWSWERALRLSQPGSRARAVFDQIEGATEFMMDAADELTGLEIVDDQTISVNLYGPLALFPMMVSSPVASVLKQENVMDWPIWWLNDINATGINVPIDEARSGEFFYEDFNETNLPVGAGPFKLSHYREFDPEVRCSFVPNDHYWGKPSGINAVRFELVQDTGGDAFPTTNLADPEDRFRRAQVDVMWADPNLTDNVDRLVDDTGANRIIAASPPYTFFFKFDPEIPPFDDVSFRRSLVAAADHDQIFELPVRWEQAIVPPRLTKDNQSVPPTPNRGHLARASLPSPNDVVRQGLPEITIFIDSPSFHADRIDRLFRLWDEELGFHVRTEVINDPSALRTIKDETGEIGIRWIEIEPEYPDPYAVLQVFESTEKPHEVGSELLTTLKAAKVESDPIKRHTLYTTAEQYILDNALALPMLVDWTDFEMLVQPWVNGFNLKRFGGSVFHDVWFDDSAPERALP